MQDPEVIVPKEQKILLLHQLTFDEVLTAKKGVSDMCGYLVGGPDRKGPGALNPQKLWLAWQRDVQAASHRANAVPQHVQDYFQRTKGLSSPPKGDDLNVYGAAPPIEPTALTTRYTGDDYYELNAAVTTTGGSTDMLDLGLDLNSLAPAPAPAASPCSGKLANPPRFATSFSGMEAFLNCPRAWAYSKYYKLEKFEETEAIKWGNRIHKTAENYVLNHKDGGQRPIDAECLPFVKRYCDFFLSMGAEIHVEQELCCTKDRKICGWRDWSSCWFRGKADLLIIKDRKLLIPDWKSGKHKDDTFQIDVMIAMADLYHGDKFDTADGKLIFVKEIDPKKALVGLPNPITKAEIPGIWERIFAITNRMEAAWESANFRMQTSGLCKKHCADLTCLHNGRR